MGKGKGRGREEGRKGVVSCEGGMEGVEEGGGREGEEGRGKNWKHTPRELFVAFVCEVGGETWLCGEGRE